MSKQYKVFAKMSTYLYVYVDANSNDEAMEIARDMDGGEFIPYDQGILGDWEIVEAFIQEA